MPLSAKDGGSVSQIKLNLFHNILGAVMSWDVGRSWPSNFSGWEEDSVHEVTWFVILNVKCLWKKDLQRGFVLEKARDQLLVSADFPHKTEW